MLRWCLIVIGALGALIGTAAAQEAPRTSECLAMASMPPRITPVSLRRTAAATDQVTITYVDHSTYTCLLYTSRCV